MKNAPRGFAVRRRAGTRCLMTSDSTDFFRGGDIDALSAMRTDPPPPAALGKISPALLGRSSPGGLQGSAQDSGSF